jgi:hypothetical protein
VLVTRDPWAGVKGAQQPFGGSNRLPPCVYRFVAEPQQPISAASINHSPVVGAALACKCVDLTFATNAEDKGLERWWVRGGSSEW